MYLEIFLADFAVFLVFWGISRDFSGIKSIFEGFLGKSADFRGNFGGKLRQETISKKQPISLVFFLANFAKIDQFCIDMTNVGERFFLTGIIICSFNNSSLEK